MSKPVFTPVEAMASTLVLVFFAVFAVLCALIAANFFAGNTEVGGLALALFIDTGLMWLASMFTRSDAGR